MDTDEESDLNDFESARDSDIGFMNDDESEEEPSFNLNFRVLLFIINCESFYLVNMSHIFVYIVHTFHLIKF